MQDPHDSFEEFLRKFGPGSPSDALLQKAQERAGRSRRRMAWLAVAATLLAIFGLAIFSIQGTRPRSPESFPARGQENAVPCRPVPVDSCSLTRALSSGGVEGLLDQLDLASGQFAKGPNTLSST